VQRVVRVPPRVFQRLLPERPTPERCIEAYFLQRTRFESIAQQKLRRRQLTEDGNVEIGGRDPCQLPIADVRRASPKPPQSTLNGHSGRRGAGDWVGRERPFGYVDLAADLSRRSVHPG
jgi:hypothetical protein